MLVSQSRNPNAIATAVGAEINSKSPIPKLRAEIRWPKAEGSVGIFHYVAHDIKFVVEIEPRAPPTGPQKVSSQQNVQQPRETSQAWAIGGTAAVAAAVIVVTATLVEDFLTCGAGLADDPATFGLASTMLLRGLTLMGVTNSLLPAAATPARVQATATVELPSR
jgi:hypothetical protein